MPSIHITVRNKIARPAPGESVVSDNDDYRAVFDFDEEWDGVTGKVARFVYGDEAADVPFEGTCCPAPVLPAAKTVKIGVYAGETLATSPAVFPIRRSVLSFAVPDGTQ